MPPTPPPAGTGWWPRTGRCSTSAPRSSGSAGSLALHVTGGGDGGHGRRRRLLAGGRRRRSVRLRRRPLRRVDGRGAPHPARGGHGGRPGHRRLLAGGVRRRGLHVRRALRGLGRRARSSHSPVVGHGAHRRWRWLLVGGVRRRGVRLRRRPLRGVDGRGPPDPARGGHGGRPGWRTGGGYWLVGADGGIFSFGAPYEGSTGALVLDRAVVAMAATADGGGYWLVGADGGVYALGDARYQGSVAVAPAGGADRGASTPATTVATARRPGDSSTGPSTAAGSPSRATPPAPRPTTATPSTPSTSTWPCAPRPCSRADGARVVLTRPDRHRRRALCERRAPPSPTPSTPMWRCRSTPTAGLPGAAGSPSTRPCPW